MRLTEVSGIIPNECGGGSFQYYIRAYLCDELHQPPLGEVIGAVIKYQSPFNP